MTTWSPLYSTGTVALANGGTTVTGVGTNWSTAGIQAGDQFKALGLMTTITAVTDNTHLAVTAWPGTSLTAGSNYEVVRLSDADRLIAANAALAQSLVPNLTALGSLSGVADQIAYFNGAGTMALTGLTSQARTFNAAADGPTARAAIVAAGPASGRIENLTLAASVGSNALTMAVKGQDGNNPSATNPVYVAMRSATAGNGGWNLRTLAAALSLVVPSGATLGHTSAVAGPIYWYLQDNGGTLELAASATDYGDSFIGSSTTISSGATSGATIYAATGRSNVPMHKIGQSTDTQTTAGTWAAVPSAVSVEPLGGAQSEYFKGLKTATNILVGALGATDNRLLRADGTGTLTAQGSAITVDDSGNVSGAGTLGVGAITTSGLLTTSNGQIAFPATQNPSAGANVLDDYEEGTWTPALQFGGAGVGITYSSQLGRYLKIGKQLCVPGSFTLTSKGSSTGSATVASLPFTSDGGVAAFAGTIGYPGGVADAKTVVTNASTVATLYTAGALVSNANFTGTDVFNFDEIYQASS